MAVPRRLFKVFTYSIPSTLAGRWLPGMRVRAPFGREILTGYIVAVTAGPDPAARGTRIREILERVDEEPTISPELLALTAWVADRYLAPLGQCLRLAFPGSAEPQKHRSRARPGSDAEIESLPGFEERPLPSNLNPLREALLDALTLGKPASLVIPASTAELIGLYKEAIQLVLDAQRSALLLVPETDRIPPLQKFLSSYWPDRCFAYHAELPPAQRRRTWDSIRMGGATVVIGTRSAAFAPVERLGLILVDHEDHLAYKSENVPLYDARTVAAERARRAGATLVLASSHPSVESVHASGLKGELLAAALRSGQQLPVRVVNLRETPHGEVLSAPLVDAIAARLAARRKVLLFLNRKGYAPVLVCRDCGQAVRCPACAVGWTYFKQESILRCRHCGRTAAPPETCPACSGLRLFPAGFGTEAVEEAVKSRFPAARVARLEKQRRGRTRAGAILSLMRSGDLDILIGTQLVVTREPEPSASLVGLIYPDAALHLPDFRAAEQAFHTLREVIALADPRVSDVPGAPGAEVIIQTYVPQHHVIRALAGHDPWIFYEQELADRAALGYPPFGRLIGLRVTGLREDQAAAAAARWAALLQASRTRAEPPPPRAESPSMEVLGPIPASPARLRGRYRWQIILKGRDEEMMGQAVRTTLAAMETRGHAGRLRYEVDVDPQSLLG